MKKVILLFFAVIMATMSCKKENSNPDSPGVDTEPPTEVESNTLPKQIVLRNGDEVEGYTITYKSGKMIDKITGSNGMTETYHYEGNLIKRIDYGNEGNKTFFYDKDKLIRDEVSRSGSIIEKTEYSYPSSNKIVIESSYADQGNWETEKPITLEFDSKGNVIKGGQEGLQATVSYNDKNTPFLNVEGWSKINFTGGIPLGDHVDISDIVGRRNSPSHTKVTDGGSTLLDLTFIYEFTDKDNANFPTKISGEQGAETVFTAEICYSSDCNLAVDPGNPNDPNNPGDPNNPEDPNQNTGTLPETIVMTSGGETEEFSITYQVGTNKIDKITSKNGQISRYEYNGDRIEKIVWNSESNGDYNLYVYDGDGRLAKDENHRSGGDIDITELSYSESGAVISGGGLEGLRIELSYDTNGNFTGAVLFEGESPAGQISITYDNKNAPFKDVVGWGNIRILVGAPLGDNIGFEDIMGAGNNPSMLTGKIGNDDVKVSYEYEFNDSNHPDFPTKVTGTKKVGTATAETFTATITYK